MKKLSKTLSFLLIFFLSLFSIHARVVRTGYIRDSGKFMSGNGPNDPKKGYAYEYLQKIASYTGWTFEYVYGSWSELYNMLLEGEIDILPDVSYAKEKEDEVLFPRFSMGRESYYLYENTQKSTYDGNLVEYLDGKTLAIAEGTYQYVLFRNWLKNTGANLKVSVFPPFWDETLERQFEEGKSDLYLSIDTVASPEWNPIEKIGESEIYLAVSKNNTEILNELNKGMEELYFAYPYFNEQLWLEYFGKNSYSKKLSSSSLQWLENHKTVKIGYKKNEVPFSYINAFTNNVEGLLVTLINNLTINFNLHDVDFEYVAFDSSVSMRNALSSGEIDLAFPLFERYEELENENLLLSTPFVSVDLVYVSKGLSKYTMLQNIAVESSEYLYSYIREFYPDTVMGLFPSTEECLKAVMADRADGAVMTYYQFQSAVYQNKKFKKLQSVVIPVHCGISFAVSRKNYPLLSMINRLESSLSDSEINTMLTQTSMETKKYDFRHFVRENIIYIILFIIIFVSVVMLLIYSLGRLRSYINYDVLTHLLNRKKMNSCMETALKRAQDKNEPFSLLLFDLDDFKKVNDTYGHECGDMILKMAASTISRGVKASDYVFRWGGEEILVLLKSNKTTAVRVAERIRFDIESQVIEYKDQMIKITATVGVASYEDKKTARDLFALADENLYTGKNSGKNVVIS